MKFIAAVDKNWAIGNKGRLLARISEDQKNFRKETMGHVVVLGRKTLEEFPDLYTAGSKNFREESHLKGEKILY